MKFDRKSAFESFRPKSAVAQAVAVWCPVMVLSLTIAGCNTKSNPYAVSPGGGSVSAPAPVSSTKSDHELIQGEWTHFNSRDASIKERWVFTADAMWSEGAKGDDGVRVSRGVDKSRYWLDPSKNPKTIDFTCMEGPHMGMSVSGIYSIDGDTLTLCIPLGKPDRPTTFTHPDDLQYFLKRAKR
jgi:uncharacterized protein (TIGR03067 family)